jgi:hypothetical protein
MVNPKQSEENNESWAMRMLVLQMMYHIIVCPPHPFFKCRLGYPWLSTHVNVYSTPLIDEPPVLKDWSGAFRVNCTLLAGHKDVMGNGVNSGCGIHGGGWSLKVVVTGLSQV